MSKSIPWFLSYRHLGVVFTILSACFKAHAWFVLLGLCSVWESHELQGDCLFPCLNVSWYGFVVNRMGYVDFILALDTMKLVFAWEGMSLCMVWCLAEGVTWTWMNICMVGCVQSHRFVFAWVDLEFAWHGDGVFAWELHGEHSLLKGAASLVVSLSSWWVLSGPEPWSWGWEYPSLVLFLHGRFGRRTRKKGLLPIKKKQFERGNILQKRGWAKILFVFWASTQTPPTFTWVCLHGELRVGHCGLNKITSKPFWLKVTAEYWPYGPFCWLGRLALIRINGLHFTLQSFIPLPFSINCLIFVIYLPLIVIC